MKKYTQEEFDAFDVINGVRMCPTGDYSDINAFGEGCSFGVGCSFGEGCSFGKGCSHEGLTNSTYFACDRIGSEKRKTYFFRSEEGLFVRAGCFFGTMKEFENRVKEVHKSTKYEKEYMAAIMLAKIVLTD